MQPSVVFQSGPTQGDAPLVSVVICTRNRSGTIGSAVDSVLASSYPCFELVVIDQSTDGSTEQALAAQIGALQLRYVHTDTQGSGISRAIGIGACRGEIVLMTDDDCDVPTDWIAQMAAIFVAQPRVAVVFCDVLPGPHDASEGFITESIAKRSRLIRGVGGWCMAGGTNAGIGAGMGMRRSVVEQIGNFDPLLGAGTRFYSGEDPDIALRALLRGHQIYRTTDVAVRHHGFRSFVEGRKLMRGYMLGTAAMYAKLLKSGHWTILAVIAFELWRTVLGPLLGDLLRLRRPPVFGRAIALGQGFLMGLRTPVDRRQVVFRKDAPSLDDTSMLPS